MTYMNVPKIPLSAVHSLREPVEPVLFQHVDQILVFFPQILLFS